MQLSFGLGLTLFTSPNGVSTGLHIVRLKFHPDLPPEGLRKRTCGGSDLAIGRPLWEDLSNESLNYESGHETLYTAHAATPFLDCLIERQPLFNETRLLLSGKALF